MPAMFQLYRAECPRHFKHVGQNASDNSNIYGEIPAFVSKFVGRKAREFSNSRTECLRTLRSIGENVPDHPRLSPIIPDLGVLRCSAPFMC